MKIEKPIIFIGVGRCGSTVIFNTFVKHKNINYLSYVTSITGYKPFLHKVIMRIQDSVGAINRKNKSVEGYDIWNRLYKGFGVSLRDLESTDVTNKSKTDIRKFFSSLLYFKRNRISFKITGRGRIGFLKEIFPDAKFVHIIRDGRANANSLLNVDFWSGWRGPSNWRLGELSKENQCVWEENGKSFVTLAGLYWKIINEKIEKDITKYNPDILRIKYENFCNDPVAIMKDICKFTELDFTDKFYKQIKKVDIKNANYKWKKNLTSYQISQLRPAILKMQRYYGYEK